MMGLLAETSWIDVSIPLVGGLFLCCCPQWAMKSTGSPAKDEERQSMARKGGLILIAVAGLYYLTSTFSVAAP